MDEFFLDFWGGFETSRTQISRTNFFNDLVPVRDGGTRWHLSAEHYRLVRDGWHSTFYMNASSRVQKKFCLVNQKCCAVNLYGTRTDKEKYWSRKKAEDQKKEAIMKEQKHEHLQWWFQKTTFSLFDTKSALPVHFQHEKIKRRKESESNDKLTKRISRFPKV